jgi:chemotaxis protein MotB
MAKNKEEDIIFIEGKADDGPPPEEGLPPWMATFADMVTLLLCFFVLLLSFANQDIANFETMKGSMSKAFGVQYADKSAKNMAFSESPNAASSTKKSAKKDLQALALELRAFVSDGNVAKLMHVNMEQTGVMVRVPTRAVFKAGTAEINESAKPILDKVAQQMSKKNLNLVVRGHTDDRPTRGNRYASNWELSAARAAACLRYIKDRSGISPNRMKAVGYAGTRPLVPNTSNENRQINQRVEFYYQPSGDGDW